MTANPPRQQTRTDRLDTPRQPRAAGLRLEARTAALRDRLEARADSRAADALRADVREARAHVRDWAPEKAVSSDTADRYARAVDQMRASGQRPEDVACKSSFEFRRAAVVHEARAGIKAGLRDLDKHKRAGNLDKAAEAYSRVRSGVDTLRRYPPTTGDRERDLGRRSAYTGPARADVERSNGKRASLSDLPASWRDDVQREAANRDKPHLAALSLSGCRPAELKGLKVRQDDERIYLSIKGAKVDNDRGVKHRTITLDKETLAETQAGRDLSDWLGNREVRTLSSNGTTDAFCSRISRACDRAGHEQASAYTFRHQTARDLRAAGADAEERASALGHRSKDSQSRYG